MRNEAIKCTLRAASGDKDRKGDPGAALLSRGPEGCRTGVAEGAEGPTLPTASAQQADTKQPVRRKLHGGRAQRKLHSYLKFKKTEKVFIHSANIY